MRKKNLLPQDVKFLFWVRFTKILSLVPFNIIDYLADILGFFIYYFAHRHRKRIFSNISVCSKITLNEKDLKKITRKNIQLFIGCVLELPKIFHKKNLSTRVLCDNPEIRTLLCKKNQPFIVFCLHQANWELFFLEATALMPGAAVAKPSKKSVLYRYMTALRTRFGGKIISSNTAFKDGTNFLSSGVSIGIVGDQGKARKNFNTDFLGEEDSFSTLPALLSYKTNAPIFVATMKKIEGKYRINYSDPIYPNLNSPFDEDVKRMTLTSLKLFEEAIIANPESWLWIYNRYKKDYAAVILESKKNLDLDSILSRYPNYRLFFFFLDDLDLNHLPKDYRFSVLINYTSNKKIEAHFKNLSVYKLIDPLKEPIDSKSFIVAKNST